jgi:hydrogenase maturation factor HypF (carbamoyltransferase family)
LPPEGARAVEAVARGRAQRVGYRRYVLDLAQELGVTGYVKNLDDGTSGYSPKHRRKSLSNSSRG